MATVGWDNDRSKTLTIASSGTESDVLNLGSLGTYDGYRIGILSPDAVTGTITIGVAATETGDYQTLQSDGTDVNLTAAKASVLDPFPFRYMKIVSSASEAAARSFILIAHRAA